uniref:Transposase n=1 Tax=Meloidogyne hapla TaxID=6305 RepID=A0A1I8BN28_MELHA
MATLSIDHKIENDQNVGILTNFIGLHYDSANALVTIACREYIQKHGAIDSTHNFYTLYDSLDGVYKLVLEQYVINPLMLDEEFSKEESNYIQGIYYIENLDILPQMHSAFARKVISRVRQNRISGSCNRIGFQNFDQDRIRQD